MVYLLYHLLWGTGKQKSPVHPMGLPNEALLSTSHGARGPLAFVVCQESSSIFLGTRLNPSRKPRGRTSPILFEDFPEGFFLSSPKAILGKKLLIIQDFVLPSRKKIVGAVIPILTGKGKFCKNFPFKTWKKVKVQQWTKFSDQMY